VLRGEGHTIGEFYSVGDCVNHHQQADTGTKMIHIGGRIPAAPFISKGHLGAA